MLPLTSTPTQHAGHVGKPQFPGCDTVQGPIGRSLNTPLSHPIAIRHSCCYGRYTVAILVAIRKLAPQSPRADDTCTVEALAVGGETRPSTRTDAKGCTPMQKKERAEWNLAQDFRLPALA